MHTKFGPAQQRRFLILDGNRAERAVLARKIQDGFPTAEILQTDDISRAEVWCRLQRIDCVLIDYNLPEMNGLRFGQKLRSALPYIAIILVTSVGDEMLAVRALRSGISDYIPKSRINADSIHRTVARAIHIAAQARVIDEQRAELENFAYALAHDFKQPVRQIRTFTSLISEELEGHGTAECAKHLGFLNDAARRLSDLVDVMSQYTLLNKPAALGPVDLSRVIANAVDALTPYLEERNAQVSTGDVPQIVGNETLMIQVMQNLIANGVKYNKNPVPQIKITASASEGRCILAIEDNGIGIEEKYLTAIFKPLMRLHAAAEYSGTGLGLTLAHKAVVSQGGKIWCESELGQGSIFYVDVPLAEADATVTRLGGGEIPAAEL